ncbi:MAG TPA: phosphate ABC transporter permease subunit PstC [Bacteroidia bacterium]
MIRERLITDKLAGGVSRTLTLLSVFSVLLLGIGLLTRSIPVLRQVPLTEILFSTEWKPMKGAFGFAAFILGTFWVTGIALMIALPFSLLSAIYISEYAPYRLRQLIVPLIDLLAGIPPVIYGVWGVLLVIPFIQDHLAPHFVQFSTGYCVLAGGVVLAIMIVPLIVNILLEVFATVPKELREASLSLGATRWETVKKVLLRRSRPGIIAAVVLATSRAFGETIAVLLVTGSVVQVPHSVFDAGYPLPALIAANYGDMLSIPLFDSALMLAALILFVIIILFNGVSRLVLYRLEKQMA